MLQLRCWLNMAATHDGSRSGDKFTMCHHHRFNMTWPIEPALRLCPVPRVASRGCLYTWRRALINSVTHALNARSACKNFVLRDKETLSGYRNYNLSYKQTTSRHMFSIGECLLQTAHQKTGIEASRSNCDSKVFCDVQVIIRAKRRIWLKLDIRSHGRRVGTSSCEITSRVNRGVRWRFGFQKDQVPSMI